MINVFRLRNLYDVFREIEYFKHYFKKLYINNLCT